MPNLNLLRSMLVHAKGAMLGESSLSPKPKLHQLLVHRALEKQIFGSISEVPGESDFLNSMLTSMPSRASTEGKMPKS